MQNKGREKSTFFRNLIKLPGIYSFLLKSVKNQKQFVKKVIVPELETFRRENDGSLTDKDFNKIVSYYAMGVPAILGESLCVLRGNSMTEKERHCMSYLGGISGLLDDLFDDPGKRADHLEEFILSPQDGVPVNTHEKLLHHLYVKGLSFSPQPEKIKLIGVEVFKAQQKSLDQKGAGDTNIIDLTFLKGGNSFKFYRLCLFHDLNKEEEDLVYQLGGLMQLGNDIFDVWEDARDGIKTIATTATNIRELREYFSNELKKSLVLTGKLNYGIKEKRKFQRMIILGISRVFVCLDQLEQLESLSDGKFVIENFSRKQLICDMQKKRNQWRAINYYLKIPVHN